MTFLLLSAGNMANTFYRTMHALEMIEKILKIVDKKSVTYKNCIFWTGEHDRYGYGVVRLSVYGKRIRFSVHRLVYFVHYRSEVQLDTDMHVSHVCHNMSCINFEHLSYESPAVNNSRKFCKNTGECVGHHGHANCIL